MAAKETGSVEETRMASPAILPSPRPSALNYFANATRRSLRDTFSREQLIAGLKGFFWVAPLTILIWVYAEREQLSNLKNFSIPIEVRSADPRQVITVTRPYDATLTADLSGPRAQLDRVREEFGQRNDARARIEIGSVPPGPRQIEADAITDDPRFATHGVILSNLQPRVLEVYVDVLDDVMIDVKVPPGVTNLTRASFDPPQVRLTAPRSVLEAAGKPLVAYVDPASLQQVREPGRHEKVPVRLTNPIKDPNARLSTMTVSATLEVKRADVELTLRSIPVWVTYAPTLDDRYRAVYETSLDNITLIGPADQIRAIEEGTANPPPKATFQISGDDIEALERPRRAKVMYDLPEGVRVNQEDAQKTVEFRLVPREPGT